MVPKHRRRGVRLATAAEDSSDRLCAQQAEPRANQVWSLDFVVDQFTDGRRFFFVLRTIRLARDINLPKVQFAGERFAPSAKGRPDRAR